MRLALLGCCALVSLIAQSCSLTEASFVSQLSADYQREPYQRILVFGLYPDLVVRKDAEDFTAERLRTCGVEAIQSISLIFPPDKRLSSEELGSLLREHRIEAVLLVETTALWTDTAYVPPTAHTMTTMTGNIYSGGYFEATGSSHTMVSGGYNVELARSIYRLQLFDAQSGALVWIASSIVRGKAMGWWKASWNDLRERCAEDALMDLREKKLIPSQGR